MSRAKLLVLTHIEQRSVFTQLSSYVQARLYLAYISPISPLRLPYISPISPLYLPYISPAQAGLAAALQRSAADELRTARLRSAAAAKAALTAAVHGVSAADLAALHALGGELLHLTPTLTLTLNTLTL